MGFVKIDEAIKKASGKAALRGWVKRKREHKEKIFLSLIHI